MAILFIIAIIVLGVTLYLMLGSGEKAYSYDRTVTLSIDGEGFEQSDRKSETGMVFITRRGAVIDGETFPYKPTRKNRKRAKLQYDGDHLRSVSIRVPNGEKFFYVHRVPSVSRMSKRRGMA